MLIPLRFTFGMVFLVVINFVDFLLTGKKLHVNLPLLIIIYIYSPGTSTVHSSTVGIMKCSMALLMRYCRRKHASQKSSSPICTSLEDFSFLVQIPHLRTKFCHYDNYFEEQLHANFSMQFELISSLITQ